MNLTLTIVYKTTTKKYIYYITPRMTQLVSVKCQILVNFPGLEFLATEHKLRGIKNNLVHPP